MAKTQTTTSDNLKRLMWERLSQSPEKLDLDGRADEEPEDTFVRLCNSGQKEDVVGALRANLCEIVVEVQKRDKQAALRFMQRAIRLCDIISAHECKGALKLILLDESGAVWGKDFEELQELAARALEGMPKEKSEFEYWNHLAEKRNSILPYALNAMIEIALDRGIQKLVQIYFSMSETIREDAANWEIVLQIASDAQGLDNLGEALDKVFAGNPLAFEFFVRRVARMPSLSQIGKRSIEDIALYPMGPIVSGEAKIDTIANLPFSDYQFSQAKTAPRTDSPGGEFLTEFYGTLYQPQNLLSYLKEDLRWKNYSPGKMIIPQS